VLVEEAQRLGSLPPHAAPRLFPVSDPPAPETFPSLGTGLHVTGAYAADVWTRLIDLILRFGVVKPTEYGIRQREALNLTAVVTDEDPAHPHLPGFLPVTASDLAGYFPGVLEDTPPGDLSYTYGNRLRGYFGVDQIAVLIEKLCEAPYTRRAVAVTWDPTFDPQLETPPCLTQLVFNVVEGHLFLTYVARSQDIVGAWPQNTLALRALQGRVADQLGLQLGPITSHSISAHIYEQDWAHALEIVARRAGAHQALVFDPHGNFVIRLEQAEIVVELLDPAGQHVLWRANGTSSLALGSQIAGLGLASLPEHYVYLGRELQRAEDALRRGEAYDQGRA
jgi:thymidylate synthase